MADNHPRVVLDTGKSTFVEHGHPWIFSGAIDRTEAVDNETDAVEVLSGQDGRSLGWGLYSPYSQIRVRMVDADDGFDGVLDVDFFARRIAAAIARRQALGLPGAKTTGYRLVNSEGDGIPGLIVDVYSELVVVQLTTRPLVRHRDAVVEALGRLLMDDFGDRLAVRETSAPRAICGKEGFDPFDGWHTDHQPEQVEFVEHGVRFAIDTDDFQKTGHFADMREHRIWVASHARGKRVLDAYSYTGGFGLHAAVAGAAEVVCVDSSQSAIDRATHNAQLNAVGERVEAVCQKADDFLRSAYDRGQRFDIVVLDPPKLAPRSRDRNKALKVYRSMVIQATRVLADGGMLCVGSCSGAIGPEELERTLGAAVSRTGRRLYVVRVGKQAPDHPHPASTPEADYLTFIAAML